MQLKSSTAQVLFNSLVSSLVLVSMLKSAFTS